MPAILVEVPAYVQYQATSRNGVQVQGGTNWDLSRAALETPVSALVPVPTPEPDYAAAAVTVPPAAVITFPVNGKVMARAARNTLAGLKSETRPLVVEGFASSYEKDAESLAAKRAAGVAAVLEKQGARLAEVNSSVIPLAAGAETAPKAHRMVRVTPSEP